MDKRVSRSLKAIKDFKALIQLEKNVRERVVFDEETAAAFRERGEIIARGMISERTGLDLSELTPAEEKIVRAVSEYLAIKQRAGSNANRTLDQLRNRGLIEAAETAVSKSRPTQGYETLHREDLDDLSYEQIVIDHPEEFSPRALWFSRRTLGMANASDKAPARPSIPAQIRTEELLKWLGARAAANGGHISPFANADAAATLGMTDMTRHGRVYGNIQSRLDFACYRLGLPPLGLTAAAPFAEAWQQEDRSWPFPVQAMQRAAQSFRWQPHDFERLVVETQSLPGQAHLLWKAELTGNQVAVRAWAEGLEDGLGESVATPPAAPEVPSLNPAPTPEEEEVGDEPAVATDGPYWVLVCNPAKWAIDKFLESGATADTWGVRPSDASKFGAGQLAIVRVGVDRRNGAERDGREPLEPGIYAVCEIEGPSFAGTGANSAYWAADAGRDPGWPTVGVRYLRNYLGRPLTIERLREEQPGLSRLLRDGFQAASFPISAHDFHAVLDLLGEDQDAIAAEVAEDGDDTVDRLAELESKFLHASPEVKTRVSKSIERGPIGTEVKRVNGFRCQLCEALGRNPIGFKKRNGEPYVEAHHVMPVHRKEIGSLSAANIVTLCANHHREVHYGDVDFAIGDQHFAFTIDGKDVTIPRAKVKLRIGILAYGSLTTDPGEELERVTIATTRDVLTPFAVEYARSSRGREGAPTLVPVVSGGARVKAWIYEVDADLKTACDILYRREIDAIGSGKSYSEPEPGDLKRVAIVRHVGLGGLHVVLSTKLAQTIMPLTVERLADLAINSARKLNNGRDGISYLMNATRNGIETPLSAAYAKEVIRRLGVADLAQAVEATPHRE
ncbi:EVE domain-containing protein [Mesorhizobium sp. WSM3882]|uniref:EVE domain-containing protein n=1 Tax=Mesorhizobium sp. WSM3882 TaxID=2029407 RepID=UPI000BAFEFB7|nr:EVE domain-containing protein [Mesorhizobium sp. WSM3882]PBB35914.1 hypothetical protein CK214_00030 [Mesorhizobium sp. WSM3882]